MAFDYHPDPNVDTPRSAGAQHHAIVSTTNATPIEVNVSAHGFQTGDQVEIIGSQDPNAEGQWNITRTGVNTFTLDGSTGTLAGGAIGYVQNWTVLPNIQLADDGQPVNSSVLMPPHEGTLNSLPFFYRRVGEYRLYQQRFLQATDDTWASWSTNTPGIFNTAAWADVASGSALFGGGQFYVDDGDIFELWMTLNVDTTGGGVGIAALALGLKLGASTTRIPGSAMNLLPATGMINVTLHANTGPIITGGGNVQYDISVMGYGNVGSPQHVHLNGYYTLTLHHMKVN